MSSEVTDTRGVPPPLDLDVATTGAERMRLAANVCDVDHVARRDTGAQQPPQLHVCINPTRNARSTVVS